MRVAQFIGHSGFTSRQRANGLIDEKRVTVNGKVATHSTKFIEGDVVLVDGMEISGGNKLLEEERSSSTGTDIYIAYNKPKGIISTTEKVEGNMIDAIRHRENILPIGRLDKDSEGLILLTNVGKIIDWIINPKYNHEKEYLVTLNLPISNQFIKDAAVGIDIGGEVTQPCEIKVEPGSKRIFRVVLRQGINRQIRRMCNKYGYQVIKLQRVRIMNIKLGHLKPGEWRNLNEEELELLFSQLS